MVSDDVERPPVRLRLVLELRHDGAGVTGSLDDERGDHQRFHNWLGLFTLLLRNETHGWT